MFLSHWIHTGELASTLSDNPRSLEVSEDGANAHWPHWFHQRQDLYIPLPLHCFGPHGHIMAATTSGINVRVPGRGKKDVTRKPR